MIWWGFFWKMNGLSHHMLYYISYKTYLCSTSSHPRLGCFRPTTSCEQLLKLRNFKAHSRVKMSWKSASLPGSETQFQIFSVPDWIKETCSGQGSQLSLPWEVDVIILYECKLQATTLYCLIRTSLTYKEEEMFTCGLNVGTYNHSKYRRASVGFRISEQVRLSNRKQDWKLHGLLHKDTRTSPWEDVKILNL